MSEDLTITPIQHQNLGESLEVSGVITLETQVHDLGEGQVHDMRIVPGVVEDIQSPEPDEGAMMYDAEQKQFFYYNSIDRVWELLERDEIFKMMDVVKEDKNKPVITRATRGRGFSLRR